MASLPVIQLGHPSLRKRAEEITVFDDQLAELAENMIETMDLHEGIGLAGPQVNILQRIFVIDMSLIDEELQPRAFINPRIVKSDGKDTMEEGCLSIPNVRADVTRPFSLTVAYQTVDGESRQEEIDDMYARVYQHELDHLDGILFIDKLSILKRKMLEPQLKKILKDNSIL